MNPHDRFNPTLFRQHLNTNWLGQDFRYLPEVDSTNTYCRTESPNLQHGAVVLADHQQSGRGQHNRSWSGDAAQNLTFSIFLLPGQHKRLHTVTQSVALGCAIALQPHTDTRVMIKWPNDLYCNRKKIGGILVESSFSGDRVEKLIIGIGININQQEFPADIPNATSLRNVTASGNPIIREQLLAQLLAVLEQHLETWILKPEAIRRDVNRRMMGFGCYGHVELDSHRQPERYKFMGINEEGFPVFVDADADIKVYRREQVRFHPEEGPCDPVD